ncbi:MAG: flagellar hook-length control protein [Geobacteraceae bacterium]|nr:MAG: flagellar hook-length control protein [Geobacteraceae bacterium]
MEILQSMPQPQLLGSQEAVNSLPDAGGKVKPAQSGAAPLFGLLLARLVDAGTTLPSQVLTDGQSIGQVVMPDTSAPADSDQAVKHETPDGSLKGLLEKLMNPDGKEADTLIVATAEQEAKPAADGKQLSQPIEKGAEPENSQTGKVAAEGEGKGEASQDAVPVPLQALAALLMMQMQQPTLQGPLQDGGQGEAAQDAAHGKSGIVPATNLGQLIQEVKSAGQNQVQVPLQGGGQGEAAPDATNLGQLIQEVKTAGQNQEAVGQISVKEQSQKVKDAPLPAVAADVEAQKPEAPDPATAKQLRQQNAANSVEIPEARAKAAETPAATQKSSAESLLSRSTVIHMQETEQAAGPARPSTAAAADAGIDPSQVEVVIQDMPVKEAAASTDAEMKSGMGEKGRENPTQSAGPVSSGSFKAPDQVQPQTEAEAGKSGSHEHIMAQVKERLAALEPRSGDGQITLKLHPEQLGELRINVQMVDQRLKVEIVAQNQTVKDALMQNLDSLKETLSRQNITMERFDVSTGGQGSNQPFREGRQTAQTGYYPPIAQLADLAQDQESTEVRYWQPRENSLVDVRL